MKILLTADWHLGKVFEQSQVNFSLYGEHERILERIVKIADDEKVDAVVIAGDIFDSYNPPNEARSLFNRTLVELSQAGERPVIVISGNHDSPEGLASIKPFSERSGIFIHHLPGVEILSQDYRSKNFYARSSGNWLNIEFVTGETVTFYLLPYVSETRLNESFSGYTLFDKALSYNEKLQALISEPSPFEQDHLILVSHIFAEKGILGGSEKTLILGSSFTFEVERIPKDFSLVFLGHLHMQQQIDERIFYPGSIFPMNVREIKNSPAKSVSIFELHDGGFERHIVEVVPGDYVRVVSLETIEEALRLEDSGGLIFIEVKSPLTSQTGLSEVVRKFRGRLLGITFGSTGDFEDDYFGQIDPSTLTDRDLFTEFFKRQTGKEPDEELVRLFLEILNEVRNEAG